MDYEIIEIYDLFNPGNPELGLLPGRKPSKLTRLVVMDHTVDEIFGERIRNYFSVNRLFVEYLTLPGGDENKTLDQVLRIARRLSEIGTHRVGTPPIAIGGGVLQDVVGMASSLYRRGIPYVRVPTTLLAQIDGSVSAKNGVNYEGFRNRLGTFAPPPRTLIDRSLIATLPERQIQSGLGEALKMALIKDPVLFELLEEHGPQLVADRLQDSDNGNDAGPGREVMHRAISGMAEELQKNLWETDLRRIVDYGHTFSPVIEMQALPALLHGEVVAMDCVLSAVLALHRGMLTPAQFERIVNTTRGMGLAPSHPMFADPSVLRRALADTMRHRDNQQHLTLLQGIGRTIFVNDLTDTELDCAAQVMTELLETDESGVLSLQGGC
ncbi:sedoheptulose 7-phosphate cyclase [Streptomyces hygroscopicus]|uniref:sedoheptulose 7-phosphate cyclase n=1 Tax=Streptomyces hygroscopicus TaxID=1912 RepID=UPI00223EB8E9|nr:sedoheptulose 7-phosphate cyclase [Streptomyces hygroscopicus]